MLPDLLSNSSVFHSIVANVTEHKIQVQETGTWKEIQNTWVLKMPSKMESKGKWIARETVHPVKLWRHGSNIVSSLMISDMWTSSVCVVKK